MKIFYQEKREQCRAGCEKTSKEWREGADRYQIIFHRWEEKVRQLYCKNGRYHREGGPAILETHNADRYYLEGKCYREAEYWDVLKGMENLRKSYCDRCGK